MQVNIYVYLTVLKPRILYFKIFFSIYGYNNIILFFFLEIINAFYERKKY